MAYLWYVVLDVAMDFWQVLNTLMCGRVRDRNDKMCGGGLTGGYISAREMTHNHTDLSSGCVPCQLVFS